MSTKEQIVTLLDSVPESDLRSVLILVQGLAVSYDDFVEQALDEADYEADHTDMRMTHEEVFGSIRERIDARVQA